jgi:hypothetical protein
MSDKQIDLYYFENFDKTIRNVRKMYIHSLVEFLDSFDTSFFMNSNLETKKSIMSLQQYLVTTIEQMSRFIESYTQLDEPIDDKDFMYSSTHL